MAQKELCRFGLLGYCIEGNLGEAALDTEGMQTMRTLTDNMAWILAKIYAGDSPDYPQHESEWQGMNFIR